MKQVEEVFDGTGRLLAIFVRGWQGGQGVHFFTDPEQSLQLGWMRHSAGKQIEAHEHKPAERTIDQTCEALIVTRGKLRVDLYGDGYEIQRRTVEAGDAVLLIAGGHGFEALEDVEAWEVRTGPYLGRANEKKAIAG